MKRTALIGVLFVLIGAGILVAKKWDYENYEKYVTITTDTTGGNVSAVTDTIWFNRSKIGSLMPYGRYYLRVLIGKMLGNDTLQSGHAYGNADTVFLAIKKKAGSRVVLIDSSKTVLALKSAVETVTVMLAPINDTIWAEDMFAWIRIADTQADTAGLSLRVRTKSELYVKE